MRHYPLPQRGRHVGVCVQKAMAALVGAHIAGEVIAADNGSTDGSDRIAKEFGAKVIHVSGKGYGKALMAGIAAASGRYIIMGDADDSYDFSELPRFVARLREGFELVQGCRLPAGGGTIARGAMRWSHRIGNPLLSFLARFMFKVPAKDIYCGFRGFTKHLYSRIEQRCHGMEFATEMLIKATLHNARISELPSRSVATVAQGVAPICGLTAMDGGRCVSSCFAARDGSSFYLGCC